MRLRKGTPRQSRDGERRNTGTMQKPKSVLDVPQSRAAQSLRFGGPVLILAAGLIGFLILSHIRGAPAREARTVASPLVETVPVVTCDSGVDIKVDGIVVPYREIAVSSEVPGRVKYKAPNCRPGHYVTKGSQLIQIDPTDFQLEVRRLSMELEQAKVMLEELDVEIVDTKELVELAVERVDIQRRELGRLRSLSGDQVVTETKVDQAASAELAARNALSSMRSQRRLLKTRRSRLVHGRELVWTLLTRAQLDLERTTIKAPTNGVIVQDNVEEHSYVQKGLPLFALEDTSSAEVKCNLRAEELEWVRQRTLSEETQRTSPNLNSPYQLPPTPATVVYAVGGREYAWDGVLARYDGIGLDEQTRTVPCRVVVSGPRVSRIRTPAGEAQDGAVLPVLVRGMYVTILIHTRPDFALLQIPRPAVRPGNIVWLVENGKLRRQKADILQRVGDGLLVDANRAGIVAGARVVVSPLVTAYDGMVVRERRAL